MRLFVNADGQNILLVQFDVLRLIHSCLWLKLFWSRPPTQIESVSLQLVSVCFTSSCLQQKVLLDFQESGFKQAHKLSH